MLARQRHSAAVAAKATTVSLAVGVLALVVRSMDPASTVEPAADVAPVALAASASQAAIVDLPSEQTMSASLRASDFPVSDDVTDLLLTHFGPHAVEALVVVQCESSFRPGAVGTNTNGTQDHGLFQINDVHRRDFERVTGQPWSQRYDPETNVEFAAWLFRRGGWGPWTCSRMLDATD